MKRLRLTDAVYRKSQIIDCLFKDEPRPIKYYITGIMEVSSAHGDVKYRINSNILADSGDCYLPLALIPAEDYNAFAIGLLTAKIQEIITDK